MASQWNDKRPMAPHLQIWRWHPAMLSSILHRASAIICYVGLIKVAVGLLALALTGKLPLEKLIFSPLGAIGLFSLPLHLSLWRSLNSATPFGIKVR